MENTPVQHEVEVVFRRLTESINMSSNSERIAIVVAMILFEWVVLFQILANVLGIAALGFSASFPRRTVAAAVALGVSLVSAPLWWFVLPREGAFSGDWWLAILFPIMAVALIYVGWMYVRDSHSVGWKWASFLGLLRSSVYILLAIMFLLPAKQHWDKTETSSKILLMFDVSGSMDNKDDMPTETMPVDKLLTRQDKVLKFLSDEQINFLRRLQDKTPVTIYRFGGRLDEQTRSVAKNDEKLTAEEWASFLKPKPPTAEEKQKAPNAADHYETLVNATNVDEALRAALNREGANLLQGIIVVSDGRNTSFNSQVFAEVQTRAAKMQVPIFTVAVGEHREPINLRITELLAPEQHPPDEKFPIRLEIDGEGLADARIEAQLEIYGPAGGDNPVAVLAAPAVFKLGAGTPHAQAEFIIDPAKLPAALLKKDTETGRPELVEGKWKFIARVPEDKREIDTKDNVSNPEFVQVVKKPLRVLLFAGGPTRDYQFARTLFVREVDAKRAELSIFLQGARKDIVQDVPPERLLNDFPNAIKNVNDPSITPEEKYLNFMQYDVIICFDPDWTKLGPTQTKLLEEWVQRHAGGLVLVAGPVHTYELTRAGAEKKDNLRPIIDLYPVVLADNRIHKGDHLTTKPTRLYFPGVTSDIEFLKLDDEGEDPLSGWERFFTGAEKTDEARPLRRGFFDFYPITSVKPGAKPLAVFGNARHRTTQVPQPYLVNMQFGGGHVLYIGSGELWRLRMYKEAFHERAWTKMARYAASGSQGGVKSRGRIDMGKTFLTRSPIRAEARVLGTDMKPLPPYGPRPKAKIVPLYLNREAVTEFLKRHKLPNDISTELQSINPDLRALRTRIKEFPVLGELLTPELEIELTPKLSIPREKWTNSDEDQKLWDGWFTCRFESGAVPGKYEVQLSIPGVNEPITRDYEVKPSNPERNNTRPDPVHLFRASGLYREVVRPRLNEQTRNAIRPVLERTNKQFGAVSEDELRLQFDMSAASTIPDCIVEMPPRIHRSRGRVEDMWDSGFEVGSEKNPYKISFALLVIIGLLSIEWLTRKLLRLA